MLPHSSHVIENNLRNRNPVINRIGDNVNVTDKYFLFIDGINNDTTPIINNIPAVIKIIRPVIILIEGLALKIRNHKTKVNKIIENIITYNLPKVMAIFNKYDNPREIGPIIQIQSMNFFISVMPP